MKKWKNLKNISVKEEGLIQSEYDLYINPIKSDIFWFNVNLMTGNIFPKI